MLLKDTDCSNLSVQDQDTIALQLGRSPRGLIAIPVRTDQGVPVVLQMKTVVDDELFPTLFWLSSKDLHRAIAEIETAGFVKKLDDRLYSDEALKECLYQDHLRYKLLRESGMSTAEKAIVEQKGLTEILASMGIGGSRNWHTVRCLHMHYAQHLVDRNCIGEILDDEFHLDELVIKK